VSLLVTAFGPWSPTDSLVMVFLADQLYRFVFLKELFFVFPSEISERFSAGLVFEIKAHFSFSPPSAVAILLQSFRLRFAALGFPSKRERKQRMDFHHPSFADSSFP